MRLNHYRCNTGKAPGCWPESPMAVLSWLTLRKFPSHRWKKPTSGPVQKGQQNLSMSRHQVPEKMGPLVWRRLMEACQGREPMSPSPQRLPQQSGCKTPLAHEEGPKRSERHQKDTDTYMLYLKEKYMYPE